MLDSFDEVCDQELLLASGGAGASALLKAAKAFTKTSGEVLGPGLDGYMVYEDIQDRKEILHHTEISSANRQTYLSDSAKFKDLQGQYDQMIDNSVSVDELILKVKSQIGEDRWPDFVEFVNSGQWKD